MQRRRAARHRRWPRRTRTCPRAIRAAIIPARTSPLPAVASRSSALVTSRTAPDDDATTVVGPLRSDDRAQLAGELAGGRDAIGPRLVPGEQGELTVVRGEHRRLRLAAATIAVAESTLDGEGVQPVAVEHERHIRPASDLADGDAGLIAPAESRSEHEGVEAVQFAQRFLRPVVRRQRRRHRLDRGVRLRYRAERVAPCRLRCAGRQRRRDTRHPACPGCRRRRALRCSTCERCANAVATTSPRRSPRRRAHAPGRRRVRCRRPRPRPRSPAPRRARSPGLSAAKVTVGVGAQHPCRRLPRETVDPTRDVDGEHGCRVDLGCHPVAVETRAVGGVDHEVGCAAADRDGRGRRTP